MILQYEGGEIEITAVKERRGIFEVHKGDDADWILSRNLKDNPPLEKLFVKPFNHSAILLMSNTDRQKVIEVYNEIQNALKNGAEVYKVGG